MEWVRFAREAIVPEGSIRVKFFRGIPVVVLRSGGKLYAYVALYYHIYYVLCRECCRG